LASLLLLFILFLLTVMEDEAKNAADFEEAPSEGVLGAMEVDRT
jgi:hypothetical protein